MSGWLWKGELVPYSELAAKLAELPEVLNSPVAPLLVETVLAASERLSRRLRDDEDLRNELLPLLVDEPDAPGALTELADFLARPSLEEKIARELSAGDAAGNPFRLQRIDSRQAIFEAWAPIGFLVHIAPTNAANVPFLSVLEGLLTGNVNFLKVGGDDRGYPLACLRAFLAGDESGTLGNYVFAARISSKQKDVLRALLAQADGVAVWGAEEALAGIRELTPAHTRVIEWGPKISFAYVAAESLGDASLLPSLAADICRFEQQACASPQVIYVDTTDLPALEKFGERLAEVLAKVSAEIPRERLPGAAEQAELSKVGLLADLETHLEGVHTRRVLQGEGWRIFIDANPALKASPLFRSVWLKPLPASRLREVLRPMRAYLQTAAVAAPASKLAALAAELFACGVLRVVSPGEMLGGYLGEPHDGVYALQRYSRRIGVRLTGAQAEAVGSVSALNELHERAAFPAPEGAIMTKEDFIASPVSVEDSELFFKSGGTSGEPKLSVFTYDDYHRQMRVAAEGLLAAGLDPARDRTMNLFFGGGLYGGFVSFFTILEYLKAVQFPMAGHLDFAFVADRIVAGRVNTLLGMPSFLIRLFEEQGEKLAQYRGVKKIFYGGEHFSARQRAWLQEKFGVDLIRSGAYGGNDTGPMGFQCTHCQGGEHHLYDRLHTLEILALDGDRPVAKGESGRLVLTSHARRGQKIHRYEIGDIGRWTEDSGDCPCGRTAPKFELLGRHGDIFRAGGMFLNYRKLAALLPGELQVVIERDARDRVRLRYTAEESPERVREIFLEAVPELREIVNEEKSLELACEPTASRELERSGGSGKLLPIIDRRKV